MKLSREETFLGQQSKHENVNVFGRYDGMGPGLPSSEILVIIVNIEGIKIRRTLVDNMSSCGILYSWKPSPRQNTLEKLTLCKQPIKDFTCQIHW